MLSPLFIQQPEERTRLHDELEEAKDKARRRSIGNIKFIGELFKLKMLTEAIMHDCVVKLLKNHDEESLECLCRLLTTIGKDLDFEKAKVKTQGLRRLQWRLSVKYRNWLYSCFRSEVRSSLVKCRSVCRFSCLFGPSLFFSLPFYKLLVEMG